MTHQGVRPCSAPRKTIDLDSAPARVNAHPKFLGRRRWRRRRPRFPRDKAIANRLVGFSNRCGDCRQVKAVRPRELIAKRANLRKRIDVFHVFSSFKSSRGVQISGGS
jgi:hypothetical protein